MLRRGLNVKLEDRLLFVYSEAKERDTLMGRQDIIERIRAHAGAVRALGATALYIYGSRARGEERPDSDLDVFVDFDPDRFGFVELIELEEMLSRELGLKVQLGTQDALHPLLKPGIEREAVRVL